MDNSTKRVYSQLPTGRKFVEGTYDAPVFTKRVDPKRHKLRNYNAYAIDTATLNTVAANYCYIVKLERVGASPIWTNTRRFAEKCIHHSLFRSKRTDSASNAVLVFDKDGSRR